MATDRARNSYDASRHYRSIVAQQGRVTIEADFNEDEQLHASELRADLTDIIGPTGTSDHGYAIRVAPPYGIQIHRGSIYVGGVRVTLDADVNYASQVETEWLDAATPPDDGVPTTGAANELVYLEVIEQEVSAVEDPALREVALGGPDTAGRTRLLQHVHRATSDQHCEPGLVAVLAKRNPGLELDRHTMELHSKGRLLVDFVPVPDADNLCQPIAQAGFLGAENQLIRVQVTSDGSLLWGYDNASFLYRVKTASSAGGFTTLELAGTPVDAFHRPRQHQWVEVLRATARLDNDAFVAAATGEARAITSYTETASANTITLAGTPVVNVTSPQLFARIWEGTLASATAATELIDADGTHTGVRITTSGTLAPGDFWMIGVRPNHPDKVYPARLALAPQPPDGPARWATPLATIAWSNGGKTGWVHDCRRHFKPLTEHDDLAFHNKHLHGWGVVCGLQVRCVPPEIAARKELERPREWVDVFRGYAIDPEGHDIRLHGHGKDKYIPLDIGELAIRDGALTRDANGTLSDGTVSLWIDRHRGFHVEPFVAKNNKLTDLLEGTILKDIIDDCLLTIVNFVRGEVTPAPAPGGVLSHIPLATTSGGLVGTPAKRLIAILNMVVELINRASAKRVYISQPEHVLLKDLFDELVKLLASKSFCGLYQDVVFPAYDIYRNDVPADAPRPTTIFGTGRHTRIRVNSLRKLAHTCGKGSTINTYDLTANELISVTEFPSPDAQVQDIAFSKDGNTIYAAAWIGSAQSDSLLAVGSVGLDGTITWTGNQVHCTQKLVTLVTDDATSNTVYAAARGTGLWVFDTSTLAQPRQLHVTFASGHLVGLSTGQDFRLYFGYHTTNSNPVCFNTIGFFDVAAAHANGVITTAPGPELYGEDLAVVDSNKNDVTRVYAIVSSDADQRKTRQLYASQLGLSTAPMITDLGPSTGCRIAYSDAGNWSMITYEDDFDGRVFSKDQFFGDIHPLQIGPSSVAADRAGDWFYILNWGSNTITAVPATAMPNKYESTIDLEKLEKYRRDVLAAFLGLTGRFLQYLKDCICDKLLVDCPDGRGKKVYLADIAIKDGSVYQICNFHNRRYVHTFPTVEYWMSLVPVIPLIKRAVETVCCKVLGNVFDKYVPKENDDRGDKVSVMMVRNASAYVTDANLPLQYKAAKTQAFVGLTLAKTALYEKLSNPPPGKVEAPSSSIMLYGSADNAEKLAGNKGVTISGEVTTTDKTITDKLRTALKVGLAAPTFARGDKVDLIKDPAGKVVGIQKATDQPAGDDVASLKKELAALRTSHSAMQKQMKEMADHLETIIPKKKH